MKISSIHPDNYGVTFSLLCILHCFVTPFLFIAQSHFLVVSGWWQSLNFLFLLLSLIAVYKTTQNSSSLLIKISLFLAWAFLSFLIISEEYAIVHLPEFITYITGFTLAGLHIYNKKYCQCNDGDCCVD